MPNAYGLELDTQVALHTEGVDRNALAANTQTLCCWVALHTEGVDRNLFLILNLILFLLSPSTRRAWIEISCTVSGSHLASTYGSHPLYKVHMWSLYGGGILLIVTQRRVQLFRVSISSRKLKNPERESVRDFFVLHGVTVQNFNQNLRNIILRIYLHKLVNDIDADDIISQR